MNRSEFLVRAPFAGDALEDAVDAGLDELGGVGVSLAVLDLLEEGPVLDELELTALLDVLEQVLLLLLLGLLHVLLDHSVVESLPEALAW